MDLRQRLIETSERVPLALDGSHGEGGGQILRTGLALAVALGRPVAARKIRAGRPNPGLQPQHLAVVRALTEISGARVEGAGLGATELSFEPRTLRASEYRFDVGAVKGSAGSVSLLFESLLLPLALADAPSRLTLIGGTHVPWSPPVHYLTEVLVPALRTIGVDAEVTLRRWGWYPAGGGEISATIRPVSHVGPLVLGAPGRPPITGLSAVSRLPRSIAERQRRHAEERLAAAGLAAEIGIEVDTGALGPGTVLFLAVRGRAGFSALGRKGLPAESVADAAVDELLRWHASRADLDERLADQLLPFLALSAARSTFTCPALTGHLSTVAWVIEQFLGPRVRLLAARPARVEVLPPDDRRGDAGGRA